MEANNRIVILFLVSLWLPDWFHLAHTEILPGVILLVAFLIFFDWVRRQEEAEDVVLAQA